MVNPAVDSCTKTPIQWEIPEKCKKTTTYWKPIKKNIKTAM